MSKTINYSTVDQQIEKLKRQQLKIEDEKQAKTSLTLYGYSNLIKSYRDPYIITSNQGINIQILTKDTVYINEKSNKYHAMPHCSGIKNARQVFKEEAERDGYIPCKRCYKKI